MPSIHTIRTYEPTHRNSMDCRCRMCEGVRDRLKKTKPRAPKPKTK